MAQDQLITKSETGQQRFERALAHASLDGLKAILGRLSTDWAALHAGVAGAGTYEELLAALGYKLILTRQIHVQDAYTKLAPEGGIRAVLPYHDIPTQSSLPTLVNLDRTVTTTPKGLEYFTARFSELKKLLNVQT